MRISGGLARGTRLQTPKGDATRPATDGLRQAVFSSLGAWVEGAWFLDLFAGSGAYGLEALSRGALGGLWVENNPRAVACIRANGELVARSAGHPPWRTEVRSVDALTAPWPDSVSEDAWPAAPDLVFIDPPYEQISRVGPALLARLDERLAVKRDPLVVFEMPGEVSLDWPGWTVARRLGKGTKQPTAVVYRKV